MHSGGRFWESASCINLQPTSCFQPHPVHLLSELSGTFCSQSFPGFHSVKWLTSHWLSDPVLHMQLDFRFFLFLLLNQLPLHLLQLLLSSLSSFSFLLSVLAGLHLFSFLYWHFSRIKGRSEDVNTWVWFLFTWKCQEPRISREGEWHFQQGKSPT